MIVEKMTFMSNDGHELELDLTGDLDAIKAKGAAITIKEGCTFRIKITFRCGAVPWCMRDLFLLFTFPTASHALPPAHRASHCINKSAACSTTSSPACATSTPFTARGFAVR